MLYRQHENNVVGVSYGFLNKITSRCRDIVTREKNGIDSQAEQILKIYGSRIGKKKKMVRKILDIEEIYLLD